MNNFIVTTLEYTSFSQESLSWKMPLLLYLGWNFLLTILRLKACIKLLLVCENKQIIGGKRGRHEVEAECDKRQQQNNWT